MLFPQKEKSKPRKRRTNKKNYKKDKKTKQRKGKEIKRRKSSLSLKSRQEVDNLKVSQTTKNCSKLLRVTKFEIKLFIYELPKTPGRFLDAHF